VFGMRRPLLAAALVGSLVLGPQVFGTSFAVASDPLSGADALWTRNALRAAELSRWGTASKYAARIKHPLAVKLLTWRQLTAGANGKTFTEIDAFVKANPDWPYLRRLLRHAERLMPFTMTPEETFIWFANRAPASAEGAMRLGAAHIAAGETEKGRQMIRRAWIDGNFTKADQKALYRRFRRLLSRDDHIARMDRLLWAGKTSQARRMLYKVPANWQKLAQARFSLRRRRGNVDYLVAKVPRELSGHLGLVYERLRWRRRKGKDNAVDLLKGLPDALPYPQLWWREKASLARLALRKGHISEAYTMAKSHGLAPGGADYADAEWLAGWIALRFLKDHDVARQHFEQLYEAVTYPISKARAAYWAGRAAEAKGGDASDEAAVSWYRKAAEHPFAYYGQLAFARLRPGSSLALPSPISVEAAEAEAEAFKAHELVSVVKLLRDVGERGLMRAFIKRLYEISDKPGWSSLTAWLARETGRPDLAVRIAKRANRDGTALLDVAYPTLEPPALPKTAKNGPPEVPLTLAVIRQESAFRIDAKSHANARGLMQIIPPTAKRVSKGLKMRFSRIKLMTDPKYNMTLGQSYLGGLIQDFKGSYVLALAAYNAGPHRVKRWLKAHGDPRQSEVDAIDWVEMIPYNETRNYVQRVLENLQVYRLRLAETEVALGLADDLHFSEN
jgi:soluble lytic murein transglycosylase